MLIQNAVGSAEDLANAKTESSGLGHSVRSLADMDRQAARNAPGSFLAKGNLRVNQIRFLDGVVNHLTEHGCMEAARLYESPYADLDPQGWMGSSPPSKCTN